MGVSDGIWFVCPECGASNRPMGTFCFLCGHSLDTARPDKSAGAPRSPISFTSPEPVDPYKPSTNFVSSPLSFRISSLMILIAVIAVWLGGAHDSLLILIWVIAVCLGAAHEVPGVFLAVILAVVVVPALVYTVVVVRRRHAKGMPVAAPDKASAFLVAIGGVLIIEFSALVAFCMTCTPVDYLILGGGRASSPEARYFLSFVAGWVALAAGSISAVAAAAYMTRFLLGRKARRSGISGKS